MESSSAHGARDNAVPRAGRVSRVTVGKALDLPQAAYGIDDRGMAFAVFRYTSQQHNVKLREVATAFMFVAAHGGDAHREPISAANHVAVEQAARRLVDADNSRRRRRQPRHVGVTHP